MFADVVEHGAEVLHVEDEQAAVVGDAEDDVEDAVLRLVEAHEAGEELRPHLAHCGADGVPLLAEDVEEADGAGLELRVGDAEGVLAFLDEGGHLTRLADAAEVAFHVGHEAGHAGLAEGFGQHLEGDGLAGAGGAGDEAVAVGHAAVDAEVALVAVGNVELAVVGVHRAGEVRRCS